MFWIFAEYFLDNMDLCQNCVASCGKNCLVLHCINWDPSINKNLATISAIRSLLWCTYYNMPACSTLYICEPIQIFQRWMMLRGRKKCNNFRADGHSFRLWDQYSIDHEADRPIAQVKLGNCWKLFKSFSE